MAPHVVTVRGPVAPTELGIVLAHEHLFLDLRNQFTPFADPAKAALSAQPVQMANLGRLRRNPYGVKDNLLLDNLDVAIAEARLVAAAGGKTIVDCTSIGICRQPAKLRQLAERTDLHVIAGCGHYTHDTHPAELAQLSPEQIAAGMIADLRDGIDGTGVRAGIIGEIGTSDPIHPRELKCLHAAALAYRAVPAPIYVHTYPWGTRGLEAADLLCRHGVPAGRIVICHVDVQPDLAYIRELLRLGLMVEFDNFGKEFWIDPAERGFAGGVFISDRERVELIAMLLAEGWRDQLLITNDICLKSMLCHYGGWGYAHLLLHVVPMLRAAGLDQAAIDALLIHNPARLLTIAP
jgi:phosphotriesterase-related protein